MTVGKTFAEPRGNSPKNINPEWEVVNPPPDETLQIVNNLSMHSYKIDHTHVDIIFIFESSSH